VLTVANHVSWLDIPLLLAYRPTMMVAKRELVPHPVANSLATRLGTITIDRDRLMSLPAVVATVADELRAGSAVTVFPEAATWCGRAMGDFAPAFFQAALDAGVPVRPVALRYRLDGAESANAAGATESANAARAVTTVPAFVGGIGAIGSLRRVLSTESLVAEAIVLPEIDPTGLDRRTLARLSREAIAAALRRDGPAPPREPHRDTRRVLAPRDGDPATATVPAAAIAVTSASTDTSTGVASPNGVSDAGRAPRPRVPRRTDEAPPAR
jgi:1-acyl-sn-glycerol-3-phosphate acyltransferase